MYKWSAKVHKSGSKVRVYDDGKFIREVEASAETFEPAEAKDFAKTLVAELEQKTSKQIKDPAADPSIDTKSEEHIVSTTEVDKDSKGTDVEGKASSLEIKLRQANKVNAALKEKLAEGKRDRDLERKARRGLAIAREMIHNGKLENDYEIIHSKVAEIVKLENREIDILERKVAGESEFETVEEARKEARRQKRLARINRVAAEDAQADGDESQADQLDMIANTAEKKAKKYAAIAEAMEEKQDDEEEEVKEEEKSSCEEKQEEPEDVSDRSLEELQTEIADEEKQDDEEEVKKEDDEEEKQDDEEEVKKEDEEEKQDDEEVKKEDEEEKQDDEEEEVEEEEKKATVLKEMSRKYRRIASKHRKLATSAESDGNNKEADKQDELADSAEEKAEDIEDTLKQMGYVENKKEMKEEKQEDESEENEIKKEEEKQDDEEVKKEDEEEKQDDEEVKKEDEEEKQDDEEVKKEASALTRKGEVIDGFGFDKSANTIENNEYAGTSEVDQLSSMWRGAPEDEN